MGYLLMRLRERWAMSQSEWDNCDVEERRNLVGYEWLRLQEEAKQWQ